MDKPIEQQIQKIFQSLFSKEQLRKNLYIYQHLNSDMSLRIKVVCQERKIAAISKDPQLIVKCLQKCPLVKIVDNQTIIILISGDALIVKIQNNQNTSTKGNNNKKIIQPLLKDIKHQIREADDYSKSEERKSNQIQVQFQSETSVNQFIQRIKNKNLSIRWELKSKDPYECIKKSIKYLLKQRKNNQGQGNYYHQNSYNRGYYNSQTNYQNTNKHGYNYGYNAIDGNKKYQTFIRKAVESDQQNEKQTSQIKYEKSSKNISDFNGGQKDDKKSTKNVIQSALGKQTKTKDNSPKINEDDFPQL